MKKLALLAALAGSLAATDAARAATVMHDAQGNVVLDAAPGETNTVFVQSGAGGTVILNDATAPMEAWDDGCAQIGDAMVECAAGSYVALYLDDGNDRAAVDLFFSGRRLHLRRGRRRPADRRAQGQRPRRRPGQRQTHRRRRP